MLLLLLPTDIVNDSVVRWHQSQSVLAIYRLIVQSSTDDDSGAVLPCTSLNRDSLACLDIIISKLFGRRATLHEDRQRYRDGYCSTHARVQCGWSKCLAKEDDDDDGGYMRAKRESECERMQIPISSRTIGDYCRERQKGEWWIMLLRPDHARGALKFFRYCYYWDY